MKLVVILLAATTLVPAAVNREVGQAVQEALRWHYQWIQVRRHLPPQVVCSVATAKTRSFVHCEALRLSMDVLRDRVAYRVVSLNADSLPFSKSVLDFKQHRADGELGAATELRVMTGSLTGCHADAAATRLAMELSRPFVSPSLKRGLQAVYPRVCVGDPFYLVFLLKDNKPATVLRFEISDEGLKLTWGYDAGSEQRNIPDAALRQLRISTALVP